jgi:MoaA/NifB/PqqE/SkfB family radical SAM enzyme
MNCDGFDERPFLVFWEITRACALSCKHCRAEAQSHRHPDELNRELKPARWSVFLLVPTGRAGIADLPDPQDIEMIFRDMADLVGKAPFAIKTTEGHHFRHVVIQKHGGSGRQRPGMRSPLGMILPAFISQSWLLKLHLEARPF